MTEGLFDAMRQSIVDGDADAAAAAARAALDAGVDPLAAIDRGFVAGLEHVGAQFNCGEMFLPDMMLAARAMKAAVAVLGPIMAASGTERHAAGRVVIGTSKARGLRPAVKVLVGGVPVTDSWASQIGADGYSRDAVGAVAVAKRLVGAGA